MPEAEMVDRSVPQEKEPLPTSQEAMGQPVETPLQAQLKAAVQPVVSAIPEDPEEGLKTIRDLFKTYREVIKEKLQGLLDKVLRVNPPKDYNKKKEISAL